MADGVLAVLVLSTDVPPQGLQDAMGLMETTLSLKCVHFLNTVTAFSVVNTSIMTATIQKTKTT